MKKLVLIFGFFVALPAVSLEIPAGDYKGRKDVAEFVQRMALETDYTEAELVQLFSEVEKQEHLFAKLDKPAEKELDWYQLSRMGLETKLSDVPEPGIALSWRLDGGQE